MTFRRIVAPGIAAPRIVVLIMCTLALAGALLAFQKPFRQFISMEPYDNIPLPQDWQEKSEWVFARLMYPQNPEARFGGGRYRRWGEVLDWHAGGTSWTQDYPRADRHFSQALRRLTRIQVRSVEQPVMMEDGDEAFNWPWIYAVQVGEWGFTQQEAKVMREYLLRGGFFMADDFHGDEEWEMFLKRIRFVFPDRPIVEIPDDDPIFHTVFDLNDRFQLPGAAHLYEGCKNCREGGRGAHWRGIYDDKGRIMVAISYNSDVGDAWEFADDP